MSNQVASFAVLPFKPEATEPPQSRAWEIYEPLFYRYVERLSQWEVADQLGMSVRNLRRKERAALETLADWLWEQFDLDVVVSRDTSGGVETDAQPAVDGANLSEELAWVKEASQEGYTSLGETLEGVLGLAWGLAEQHGVRLYTTIADVLPDLAANPVAVRHILLNLLSVALPRAAGGYVSFSVEPLRWEVQFRVCQFSPQ